MAVRTDACGNAIWLTRPMAVTATHGTRAPRARAGERDRTPAPLTPTAPKFALFATPVGRCSIVWCKRGILAALLPQRNAQAARAEVLQRFPGASEAVPPAQVRAATQSITALLRGEAADLSAIRLDMEGLPPFHRRVYEATRTIAPGTTLTYGAVAALVGLPGAARAVGQALARNPFGIVVPCHRVIAAGGKLGGFSADGGPATKLRLLAIEGVSAGAGGVGAATAAAPAGTADGVAQPRRPAGVAPSGSLDFDVSAALAHLRAADRALGRVIDAAGPFTLELATAPSPFDALAEAIVYQQLTGRAAATIFGRLCSLFAGGPACPSPEQIRDATAEQLRSIGLSGGKQLALRDLARCTLDGTLPALAELRAMDDEAIIRRLIAVRGIGRWTAEMFLIFRLGRPDVLPLGDHGLRRGFAQAFGMASLPDAAQVARRGRRWAPYRTVASWYLWRAAEGAV